MDAMKGAGELLRLARESARITQSELAKRAGTRQGAISAYETGKRDPTVGTLARLIEATGFELRLDMDPPSGSGSVISGSPLGQRLLSHRAEIRAVVEAHGGSNVRVFGSVARGDDRDGSDLDLLVELPDRTGLFTIGAIARDVERLVGADVDVVPEGALRPEYREAIVAEAIAL